MTEHGWAPIRVVHLTSTHRAGDTRIFQRECRSLAAAGYQVVLVVPGPPLPVKDGVRFHAVRPPKGRMERMFVTVWRVLAAAIVERGDLYHFHDPDLIPVGLILKCLGRRVIYDVHEDVPDQIQSKGWIPQFLRPVIGRIVRALHGIAGRVFDGIVVAGDDIASGFPAERTIVLHNYPSLSEIAAAQGAPYAGRAPIAIHLGGLARTRASRELVEAMGSVPRELDARLVLVGAFVSDGVEEECRALPGWIRTDYRGQQPRDRSMAALGTARIGVVLYKPGPNHGGLRSNRVFEYMGAGLPVIGPDLPAWRNLFDAVGCGILVDPASPQAIADAITSLLADPESAEAMGRRGREAVETKFSWEADLPVLLSLYAQILGAMRGFSPPNLV
ncbi:MAG: glycosyltransferase family 4 protein [Gemmatimonadales bacterium]